MALSRVQQDALGMLKQSFLLTGRHEPYILQVTRTTHKDAIGLMSVPRFSKSIQMRTVSALVKAGYLEQYKVDSGKIIRRSGREILYSDIYFRLTSKFLDEVTSETGKQAALREQLVRVAKENPEIRRD